jgi:hypothetical protein
MFDEDNRGKPFQADPEYVFTRPAVQIVVTGPNDETLQTLDLPALNLTREQVSPEWLAMHDAERERATQ